LLSSSTTGNTDVVEGRNFTYDIGSDDTDFFERGTKAVGAKAAADAKKKDDTAMENFISARVT